MAPQSDASPGGRAPCWVQPGEQDWGVGLKLKVGHLFARFESVLDLFHHLSVAVLVVVASPAQRMNILPLLRDGDGVYNSLATFSPG